MTYTITDEIAALDNLAKFATRTIRLDETANVYVVSDKVTGEVIGRYETYREARRAGR